MNKLYIILEKSNTLVGKIGRIIIPYPYTHIALSFDNESYYSYSRRKHYNPFDAGFMKEKLSYYAYEDVELKRYQTEISDEEKEKIYSFMESIKDYPFDIYGMIKSSIGINRKKDNAYNCMTFIARVFEIINIKLIKDNYYENSIEDLEKAMINSGLKGEIIKINKMNIDDDYMDKVSIKDKIKSFINLHKKLYK